MEHTPTPWKRIGEPIVIDGGDNCVFLSVGNGDTLDILSAPCISKEELSKKVDKIVRCVNAHDALANALEAVSLQMVLGTNEEEVNRIVCEALKLAKGE